MSPHERYIRQTAVFGQAGQDALSKARVLVVGAGGLGSAAAIYLASAGVGTLGIIDDDHVELSNLHRQPLHATIRLGAAKVESAITHLYSLNPEVEYVAHTQRLCADNALAIMNDYDLVVDGADSFATRYIVSDATTLLGLPHVWAAVLGAGGQMSVFNTAPGTPTYRDLFPHVPAPGSVPSCVQAGVLGVVPGILGVAQAAETIKIVTGYGTVHVGRVAVYDMLTGNWESVPLAANPTVVRPATAAEIGAGLPATHTVEQLANALQGNTEVLVWDVREPEEFGTGHIPGAVNVPLSQLRGHDAASLVRLVARTQGESGYRTGSTLVVHCQTGGRSAQAQALLASAGIEASDLTGGLAAWQRAGMPITNGAAVVAKAGSVPNSVPSSVLDPIAKENTP